VNLGSQFIIEPWMANDEWNSMGCGGTNDEWKCVEAIGQEAADAAFATHWDTWVTKEDIDQIVSYGLNTIRVPVGFWIKEDLVYDNEFYPRGGLEYLDRLVGWAKDAGLYVIMDLHGGPGSQYPNQQFTGHVSLSDVHLFLSTRSSSLHRWKGRRLPGLLYNRQL
jgi:aryl-phospho-beta-D-glucosidase BglC (GH1 family)